MLCSWTHDWSVTVPSHLYFPLSFLKKEVMEAGKITELCRRKSRVAQLFWFGLRQRLNAGVGSQMIHFTGVIVVLSEQLEKL